LRSACYHLISLGRWWQVDLLIRDVPEEVVATLDAEARRLGLSRSDYLRRALTQVSERSGTAVSVDDLARFAQTFADLGDRDVMDQAWR
jgi:hypothetical protein